MTFNVQPSRLTAADRRKMLVTLAIFLLLAFVATSMASFIVSRDSIREAIVTSELPLTSDTIYSEIQTDLLKPLFISSTMANDTFLRDWVLNGEVDVSLISKYLAEIKDQYGTITSFLVSERTGIYYYYDGVLKTVREDEPRDAWYFRVRALQDPYEINVDPDLSNQDAMTIFINYRVLDYDGNLIGVTGVGLTVNMVKNRINAYQKRYQRNVLFLDMQGDIVLHNDFAGADEYDGKNLRQLPGLSRIADQILGQERDSFEYQRDGKTVLLNARFLPELRWHLLVEQIEDDALTPLHNVLKMNLLICISVTIAVLLIVSRIIRWFQSRLEGRCQELEEKNEEIDQQRAQLEQQANTLAEANSHLEQMHREKDEWIGIVAHDLKSPLISIAGFSKLIASDELTATELKESNQFIMKSAQGMSQLVNNLLDVYEIEAMQAAGGGTVDMGPLVKGAVDVAASQAYIKKIAIDVDLPETSVAISGHAAWVTKIINNLISNALKFSAEHTTISVALRRSAERVLLTVCDQGPGLTPEDQKHLFERFSQLSAVPTAGESSTGLGLYFVKKMTEKMGGTVVCTSEPGQGACFTVDLPAKHGV